MWDFTVVMEFCRVLLKGVRLVGLPTYEESNPMFLLKLKAKHKQLLPQRSQEMGCWIALAV